MDYNNTLSSVYRSYFYDYDEEGNETLKKDLVEKRETIKKELNKKIEKELKDKVKSIIGKVKKISGDYSIDFASGFKLSGLSVDYGSGYHPINNCIGEGSRKRLFLAIMEWDKEIKTRESHKELYVTMMSLTQVYIIRLRNRCSIPSKRCPKMKK